CVEEALQGRARVLVVLGGRGPPLGEKTAWSEPRPGQLVEVARIQIDDAGRRWRWWLERDHVVAFRAPLELSPTIAHTDLDSRVRSHAEVAVEQRRGTYDRREKLGADATVQSGVAQQGACRDASPGSDYGGAAWLTAMEKEGEQGLQPHVAPGRHHVPGVRDAVDVEASETPRSGALLEDRTRPARTFGVEDQVAAAHRGEHGCQTPRRNHGYGADRRERDSQPHPRACAPARRIAKNSDHSNRRATHRQDPEGAHEPERRNENEPGHETSRDTADPVDC